MRPERAFIYPWIITAATLIMSAVVLMEAGPKLVQFFAASATKPPLTTRIIITSGDFLLQSWYAIVSAIILLTLFFSKTKKGKKLWDCLMLKLPAVSTIVKKNNILATIKCLGPLIAGGVPMAEALAAALKSVKNYYYREAIAVMVEKIKKGEKLSDALKNYPDIYPLMVSQAIEVGEEKEKLSVVLEKLGNFLEEDVARDVQNLRKITDPLLMIIIGAIIGFLAVSIVQPLILF